MSNQLDSPAAAIRSHGTPCHLPASRQPDASFEANGVLYRRDGAVISLGPDAYRCDGYSMARYLFVKLTLALL